jgi:hypothetical protein
MCKLLGFVILHQYVLCCGHFPSQSCSKHSCRYISTSPKLGLQGATHFEFLHHTDKSRLVKNCTTSDMHSPRPPPEYISRQKPHRMPKEVDLYMKDKKVSRTELQAVHSKKKILFLLQSHRTTKSRAVSQTAHY